MSEYPERKITIYHKVEDKWVRYIKKASYRNISSIEHNKDGSNSKDTAIIRIFDTDNYNVTWFVDKKDIAVNQEVNDEIDGNTPITQLSKKYGTENVYKVTSIEKLIFKDEDIKELNHIKLGCI